VKLNAEKRLPAVADSFIGAVIRVDKPWLPVIRERLLPDGIPVVLRGDIASLGASFDTGLILAAMSKLQLVRVGTGSQRQNLMAETNAQGGNSHTYNPDYAPSGLIATEPERRD